MAALPPTRWLLSSPATQSGHGECGEPAMLLVRDDLLHPLVGGNKLRKLDAVVPALTAAGVTDVLTCGGAQSAHTVAVAVACAERGMRTHVLQRGEALPQSTGYNLLAGMFAKVTPVGRAEYRDRDAMLQKHAATLSREANAADGGSARTVAVIREGAADAAAVLGLMRLVTFLAEEGVLGSERRRTLVVDSGTGTTAVGIALGVAALGLPWHVVGVMLAGENDDYVGYQRALLAAVRDSPPASAEAVRAATVAQQLQLPLSWVPRVTPRRFGKVLPGELRACRDVARATGVLLDPIYTLAGWQVATQLATQLAAESCGEQRATGDDRAHQVVMLHTGGTMGIFGLAQRYPSEFSWADDEPADALL